MSGAASYSLRSRLTRLVVGTILGIGLVSSLVVYLRAHHEADELLDTQLAQVADTLLTIAIGSEVDHFAGEMEAHSQRRAVPIAFEVWRQTQSESDRIVASPGHSGFATPIPDGYSDRVHLDKHWRLFSMRYPGSEYIAVVGQRHSARDRLARETGLSLLIPILLALPLMVLLVGWAVKRSLRPVESLTQSVRALNPGALTPLGGASVLPQEIAPLRDAFNALLERVSVALENERHFTADAAHELRTPLAALKVQAQVAQRAQTADGQQRALAQVIAGVDRMTHLVEQLLTLARVDPAHPGQPPAVIDPAETIAAVCAELLPQALRQGQTLRVDVAAACGLAVTEAWLRIALRNLVDNALRYAGEGARVEVRLARAGTDCLLSVADDGPGVAPALRSQLSARFVRGEVEAEGCGLGLSIVARIAALSHAQLEWGEGLPRAGGGHGLAVSLRFGAAAGPA
jgi:two-component system sensor histidine kinase QseC